MDDDNIDAMAAAMGFSSFGAQPSAKRRKFNSNTDSFIDAPSRNTDHGNGANAMPLGIRSAKSQPSAAAPPPPPQPKQNENEISLKDDEDDPEPQYLDTSRPAASVGTAPTPGDAAIQATIDNIIGSTGAPGPEAHHVGGHGDRHGPRQAGGDRRRGGGQPWWEDYYDPTANMNPWEKLEKQSGLEPRLGRAIRRLPQLRRELRPGWHRAPMGRYSRVRRVYLLEHSRFHLQDLEILEARIRFIWIKTLSSHDGYTGAVQRLGSIVIT